MSRELLQKKTKIQLEHAMRQCCVIALWQCGAVSDQDGAEAVVWLEDWLEPLAAFVHGTLLNEPKE